LEQHEQAIPQRVHHIQILEELLGYQTFQRFAADSEVRRHHINVFDEAELDVETEALRDHLVEDREEEGAPGFTARPVRPASQRRCGASV